MLQYIPIVLSFIGYIFIVKKSKVGHGVWFVSNLFWIGIGISQKNIPLVVQFFMFSILCFHGYYKWQKDEKFALAQAWIDNFIMSEIVEENEALKKELEEKNGRKN